MKSFLNLLVRYYLPTLVVVFLPTILPDFPIYYWAFLTEIYVVLVLIVIFPGLYGWHRETLKDFRKNFQVYEPISKLEPSDFGIYSYYETYILRESDTVAEKSLKDKGIAFITGKPRIGKTRGAFEVAKKFNDFYILKPTDEKIDIQNLKFPHLFSPKKIILFLDDLEKFAGRFGLDELIAVLRKNSKELKVLATCRTGKEFDQAFGQKEMEILLSQCQSNKVEPRILDQKEEKELVKGIGKSWEDVTSDGTPGSIVLGLDQMGKRYKDLEDEPKTILHILKLLKEARIYTWTEELVKNIAKSKIFELKGERYQWDNWLKILQENGFIQKSDSKINISHDSYLDNKFITDYSISDSILIELKDELVALKDAENLFYLGLGFDNRKNLNEAIVCYQKSIGINPNFHMAHTNLGALLYDLKRYPEAEKEYREAIRINPYDFVAHNNIGNLLYYFKRTLEAEKELKESIRINPLFAQSHNNLGNVFCDLKRYAEAEREYREALKINPDLDVAHYNLGHLFNSLIKYNEAEKEYREAIVINSSNIEARLNLSNVLYDLKRYSEAEKEYRETIRINPDSAEAHNNLGNLHKDLKIFTEAEKEYKEAIRINPDYAEAYGNLGLLYIEMEKKEEAKKELQKAKELFKKQDKEEDVKKVEDILKGLE